MSLIFVDRYGGNYPNLETICKGQCEGMGFYPLYQKEGDERHIHDRIQIVEANPLYITEEEIRLWTECHARPHEKICDGWHFVKCPDCNGTGKKV